MRLIKDEVVRLIQSLPDDCTIEDIQYHLYVRQKAERGLAAAEAGKIVSQAEAERRIDTWSMPSRSDLRSTTNQQTTLSSGETCRQLD